MSVRILPAARECLIQIWQYTAQTWDEDQADTYISGLIRSIEQLTEKHGVWRTLEDRRFTGVFFVRFKRHYVFFRELSEGALGVIAILHETMDLPSRLRELTREDE
jgi:plasmid stabilization system protein ParE